MVGFWANNISKTTKITSTMMQLQAKLDGGNFFDWSIKINDILQQAEQTQTYQNTDSINWEQLKRTLTVNFERIARQEWARNVSENRMCSIYKSHKVELRLERYLTLLSRTDATNLARFRCATPKLESVRGIYSNTTADSCQLCGAECIPNEYHLLLKCGAFEYAKAEFLPRELFDTPTVENYINLMNSRETNIIRGIARFCGYILEQLNSTRNDD